MLRAAIAADGSPLLAAADVHSLLRMVAEERPAVVILQRSFAGQDALELCRAIRALDPADPSTPAIVVVASRQDEMDVDAGNRAGVTDWLLWPFKETYARTRMQSWVLREPCRWAVAPLPENEARRLDALHALNLLDTPPEERFDRYTRIAAELFDVPIAFVSLIDGDRQWFKSRLGLDVTETPRDVAFCAHTILDNAVLQVPDALQDARFADNPFVTGPDRVRFYAGAPLAAADGSVLGIALRRRPAAAAARRAAAHAAARPGRPRADRARVGRQALRAEARRPHPLAPSRCASAFLGRRQGKLRSPCRTFGFQLNIGRWCETAFSGSGPRMAERSFVEEVKKLRLGAGEVFRGEGILAVTKALLESGVAYVAGYQGAPISHLMDVLADAAGHPGRARHPLREQRQRGHRGGDAGRVGQLPAARRGDLQGDRSAPTSPPTRSPTSPPAACTGGALSSSARTTAKARRSCRSAATPSR